LTLIEIGYLNIVGQIDIWQAVSLYDRICFCESWACHNQKWDYRKFRVNREYIDMRYFMLDDRFSNDEKPEVVLAVLLDELERPIQSIHGYNEIRRKGLTLKSEDSIDFEGQINIAILELLKLIEIGRLYLKSRQGTDKT
jgi:hypothetical protein